MRATAVVAILMITRKWLTLKEPVMEESSEVAIASNSEEESAEDQDSESDTETR